MYFLYVSFFYLFLHLLLFFFLLFLGFESVFFFDWTLNSIIIVDYRIMLDYVSIGFLCFVFLITFCVMKYRCVYIGVGRMRKRFIVLVNLFVFSMALLIVRPSFLLIILGWDGLGVISFLLVIYYNNHRSLNSGLLTVYLNRFGDYFIILSFWLLFKNLSFSLNRFYFSTSVFYSVSFILLAGMTKRAQLPFSSWLPAAIAAPTPVSSLVHSSTLVTAGVYLMIRYFYLSELSFIISSLIWVSLLTCLGAGLVACYENDLRKLVAISTLSQLGLMIFVYSLGELFYTYYHIVCHALFKALLFLGCGLCIIFIYGSQDSRFFISLGSLVFSNLILVFISVLSLMGFPFLTGFYSKDSIIEVCYLGSPVFLVYFFLLLACFLTGVYGLRSVYIIVRGQSLRAFCYSGIQCYKIWLGIVVLCFWSICLGKYYSLLFIKLEEFILTFYFKIGGLLVVSTGIFIFFISLWTRILFYHLKSFFGEIYFLNWFFGSFRRVSLERFVWLVLGEFTWLIFLGPKIVYSFFYNLSQTNLSMGRRIKISLLGVFLCTFIGYLFAYSLFKALDWRSKEFLQKFQGFIYNIFIIKKLI